MAYRSAQRRVVGGAAVPYGYTVVTWTSGGVLIESHGAPDLGGAFLFLAGAAVGFGAVAALGGTGSETHEVSAEIDRRGVGVSSAVAAAAGLGLSAGAAQFVDGAPAFAIVAFLATAAYFLVGAIGVSLLDRRPPTSVTSKTGQPPGGGLMPIPTEIVASLLRDSQFEPRSSGSDLT